MLLEMRGIEKRFGSVHALSGVDLAVGRGEVHALLGENGAGKSTLMKILAGVDAPDRGDVSLEGTPYRPVGPLEAERRGVAMIHQERSLCPDLSVVENIQLGHEPSVFGRVARGRSRENARGSLERLGHAKLVDAKRVSELGPGECQIVEIARALSRSARLIVMDEPTSSLPSRDAERLLGLVSRLRADGTSVIYISHFLEEVAKVADRYTVIRDGRTVNTGSMKSATRPELLEHMAGRKMGEGFERISESSREMIFEIEDVGGGRSGATARLSVRRGEILGVAGLLGSGRTELFRAMFGLDRMTSGRVRVASAWDTGRRPWERLRQGVGLLSEDRSGEGLALGMSIVDNLTLSHLDRVSAYGVIDRGRQRLRAERWIAALDIKSATPLAAVSSLSGGNQQKVALARLLDLDVEVLVLDEPTRGVDAVTKERIYRLLGELAARGKAVVFVSSYVPELLAVCHRITVMHRGALCEPRDASEWTETAILDIASGGGAS